VTRINVKPAEGRAVPDPENGGKLLAADGGSVPNTAYWQRRIKDNDVTLIEEPAEAPAPVAVTPKAAKAAKASEGSKGA